MQSQTALYIIRIQKLLEVKVPVLQLDILKLFRKHRNKPLSNTCSTQHIELLSSSVLSSFKIRNKLDTGEWIERGRLVYEGIKSLGSVEAGTYGCSWLTDVLVPFVLSLYQPFTICSPTLTSSSPTPLALHLLSPPFSSAIFTWNRRIQFRKEKLVWTYL